MIILLNFYKTEQETCGTFKNIEIQVEVDIHPLPKILEYNPEHIYDEEIQVEVDIHPVAKILEYNPEHIYGEVGWFGE